MTTTDQVTAAALPRLGLKQKPPRKVLGRLGPWQLLRTLGEGSMTRVYLARPAEAESAPAAYAIKSLRREWWNDPTAIEMQRREAWVGQRVNSPHVVSVLSAGVAAPPHYTVMPMLEGQTAAQLLATGHKPALSAALWIARQAAQGLDAIWQSVGMTHGDVKPANLMVGADGHTTLLDLGFCETPRDARGWAERPVVGTLRYLAPERVTSATTVDVRSDLYSLGATLYELITGRPPHDGQTPAALIQQHRTERPECLRTVAPGTPKPVASLVHRLLSKDPMRRPATPAEVVNELAPLEIECFGLR
ncbi:Serine/threonine-protein kinase PknB [Botrimarina colliarenosi]|uniref:Serine/threonine-protein kinase PknB n=1 Tax=Botrimarina colliarenosi TaxID=2528001 RepID=A0A5C6ACA8_9BACT|nr:serine/threonine-protein kinase [Botrimarina colliarenosi]TWT97046.1 Serine/threonine-protein kinase PknB [Botrimarina colliarenosi]